MPAIQSWKTGLRVLRTYTDGRGSRRDIFFDRTTTTFQGIHFSFRPPRNVARQGRENRMKSQERRFATVDIAKGIAIQFAGTRMGINAWMGFPAVADLFPLPATDKGRGAGKL
jgi:hypothetical protein